MPWIPAAIGAAGAIGGSILSLFGGGNKAPSTANAIGQKQLDWANIAKSTSDDEQKQMMALLAPYIKQQTALASGDAVESIRATMPQTSKLTQGYDAARENIFNTIPPGAAREKALADLQAQKAMGIAGAQSSAVAAAPANLLPVGEYMGNNALQQLGAAFGGLQGGAQTNLGYGQMQAAQNKTSIDFFSNLANQAGGAIPQGGAKAPASTSTYGPATPSGYDWSTGTYPGSPATSTPALSTPASSGYLGW